MRGVDALHDRLNERRSSVKILPPAVWVPRPEDVPWGRMLTVSDPFGNSLRFTEPLDQRRTGGGSRLVGLAGRTCWDDRLIMRQLPATATTTRPGPAIGQKRRLPMR